MLTVELAVYCCYVSVSIGYQRLHGYSGTGCPTVAMFLYHWETRTLTVELAMYCCYLDSGIGNTVLLCFCVRRDPRLHADSDSGTGGALAVAVIWISGNCCRCRIFAVFRDQWEV